MLNDFNILKKNTLDLFKQINNEDPSSDVHTQYISKFNV